MLFKNITYDVHMARSYKCVKKRSPRQVGCFCLLPISNSYTSKCAEMALYFIWLQNPRSFFNFTYVALKLYTCCGKYRLQRLYLLLQKLRGFQSSRLAMSPVRVYTLCPTQTIPNTVVIDKVTYLLAVMIFFPTLQRFGSPRAILYISLCDVMAIV